MLVFVDQPGKALLASMIGDRRSLDLGTRRPERHLSVVAPDDFRTWVRPKTGALSVRRPTDSGRPDVPDFELDLVQTQPISQAWHSTGIHRPTR